MTVTSIFEKAREKKREGKIEDISTQPQTILVKNVNGRMVKIIYSNTTGIIPESEMHISSILEIPNLVVIIHS